MWIGLINVGAFMMAHAFGIFFTILFVKPEGKKIGFKTGLLLISAQLACIADIIAETEEDYKDGAGLWVSLVAMLVLAFISGLLSTHFLQAKPILRDVPHKQQAQAYTQRSCMKHLGICLGVVV